MGMDALEAGDLEEAGNQLGNYLSELTTASANCLAAGGPQDV